MPKFGSLVNQEGSHYDPMSRAPPWRLPPPPKKIKSWVTSINKCLIWTSYHVSNVNPIPSESGRELSAFCTATVQQSTKALSNPTLVDGSRHLSNLSFPLHSQSEQRKYSDYNPGDFNSSSSSSSNSRFINRFMRMIRSVLRGLLPATDTYWSCRSRQSIS